MDRYLYKAKRLDNGEWATGSLITCEDGTCKIATSCLEGKANEPILVCAYDVDRDTICQCTGLKDKNGKLMWENDVVVCKEYVGGNHVDYCIEKGYVEMLYGAFGLHRKNGYYRPFKDWLENYEYEVIGNIFDNPELLE